MQYSRLKKRNSVTVTVLQTIGCMALIAVMFVFFKAYVIPMWLDII